MSGMGEHGRGDASCPKPAPRAGRHSAQPMMAPARQNIRHLLPPRHRRHSARPVRGWALFSEGVGRVRFAGKKKPRGATLGGVFFAKRGERLAGIWWGGVTRIVASKPRWSRIILFRRGNIPPEIPPDAWCCPCITTRILADSR
ncbi:hypothetical protein BCEN4_590063 [Burkholderia cenocepacia]|nr:hypothetical protein BCEN4_590063 [Burkholderia cenocepacia]